MFTKYFGFKTNPFSLAADFSFFKIDTAKQDICNCILRDLNNGHYRFLVTGASGVGKSQLLRYLFTQLPVNTQCLCLSGSSVNYSDRIRFIIELATENFHLGKKTLIAIDNAHEIPDEDLTLLFSLIAQNKQQTPNFPIIFCGLDNLEIKLDTLGFKHIFDGICCRYHLSALNESEVRDYINFRLKSVGYDTAYEKEIFSADVTRLITASSQGIPHSINLICGASLLTAFLDDKHTVSEQIVREAVMSCSLTPIHPLERSEAERHKRVSTKQKLWIEQNDQNDLTNSRGEVEQLTLPVLVSANSTAKSHMLSPLTSNATSIALAEIAKLQKKFEREVLSSIGICFLGISTLFIFNLVDNSAIKRVASGGVPYEIKAPPLNLIADAKEKVNFYQIALQYPSTHGEQSTTGAADAKEKINFYQIALQYPSSQGEQSTTGAADIRNKEDPTELITNENPGNKTIVKALLKGGEDSDTRDRKSRNAHPYAVQTNNAEMIRLLATN